MYDTERLIQAIGGIDSEKIEKASRALGYTKNEKTPAAPHLKAKRMLMTAAVIVMLLALGITAYAMVSGGVLELWPKTNARHKEFPSKAAEIIQSRDEAYQTENWTCQIIETYCDDSRLIITARVSCNDLYIPVATDADGSFPASRCGFDYSGTLSEYAADKGKKLLFMNIYVNDEKVGASSASILFENISDRELQIIYSANKSKVFDSIETCCGVIARVDGEEEQERIDLPLFIQAGSSKELGVYAPVDPDAIPGIRVTGEAILTETPLGLSIQYPIEITDSEGYYNVMYFNGEEIDFHGQGVMGFTAEDGTEYARRTEGEGKVGDTLTIHYYDWDKQIIGDIVFRKIK